MKFLHLLSNTALFTNSQKWNKALLALLISIVLSSTTMAGTLDLPGAITVSNINTDCSFSNGDTKQMASLTFDIDVIDIKVDTLEKDLEFNFEDDNLDFINCEYTLFVSELNTFDDILLEVEEVVQEIFTQEVKFIFNTEALATIDKTEKSIHQFTLTLASDPK